MIDSKRLLLSDKNEITNYFFESLRRKCIQIDNIDLANQWIEQRLFLYTENTKPRKYIEKRYINEIMTREYAIKRLWPNSDNNEY